jgi:hypothetical protein
VVRSLSSVLLVPDMSLGLQQPVRAFHPSLHDFITNNSRCTDARFVIDAPIEHGRLSARCFERMYEGLKKDVCDIRDPSLLNSEAPDLNDRIAKHISVVVRYACLYWHFHLVQASNTDSTLQTLFTTFCKERLLFSIEAASLLGGLETIRKGLSALLRPSSVRF